MDEIVDFFLCDVVKVVVEREVKYWGICCEVMDSEVVVFIYQQFDSEENREFIILFIFLEFFVRLIGGLLFFDFGIAGFKFV